MIGDREEIGCAISLPAKSYFTRNNPLNILGGLHPSATQAN